MPLCRNLMVLWFIRQARRLFQHACKLGLEHKELALSFRRTTAQYQEQQSPLGDVHAGALIPRTHLGSVGGGLS